MRKKVGQMGKKIEEQKRKTSVKEIEKDKKRSESEGLENRLKEVERMLGKKRRKRNIVIRGVEVKERSGGEAVKEIMRAVGTKVGIKEMKQ